MRIVSFAGVAVVAALAGCVQSNSIVCDSGLICPSGYQCDTIPSGEERCIEPGQLAVCDGLNEGTECVYDDLPGVCSDGACEPYRCGDGRVTMGEQCDGENLDNKSCGDLGFYGNEQPSCDDRCQFVVDACSGGRCGDGTVNGPELCDGPTTKSCVSIGFDAGTVRCDLLCGFTIRDCTKFGWNPEALDIVALGVAASTPLEQWAVGLDGKIANFDGAFWGPVESGVTNDLKAVWAVAPYAWAVGLPEDNPARPGVVLFWNGSSATPAWEPIANAPAATYNDVWAVDPMAVYIATKEVGVQRYDGQSWSPVGNLTTEVFEITGTSPSDLWAATDAGLQHWNGTAWEAAPLADTRIRFVDANAPDDVWVAGEAKSNVGTGVLAHWDGNAWTQTRTPQTIYNAITSTGPSDAWIVVAGGELRHFDGKAWSSATAIGQRPNGTTAISGFHAIDANHVVAVSTLRQAFRYRGLTFGKIEEMRLFPESNPWNSDTNTDVWSEHAANVYVTNVKGQVVHFDGDEWNVVYRTPSGAPTKAVWGSGPDNIFVGSTDGTVYRFAGNTWTPHELSDGVPIDRIWGSGPNNVWAFGSSGAFRWDGQTWTRHLLGGHQILSVAGSGTDVWAVEAAPPLGTLWHFTNGSWTQVTNTGATTRLSTVAVADATNVHVAADGGNMFFFDGTNWSSQQVSAVAEIRYMAASGPRDVVAATERELFSFDGVQWSPMRTPVDFVPNTPDYFPIVGLAASPARVDILLEKWRVRTLLRTRPFVCEPKEVCGDSIDNDCNGAIDGTDEEC